MSHLDFIHNWILKILGELEKWGCSWRTDELRSNLFQSFNIPSLISKSHWNWWKNLFFVRINSKDSKKMGSTFSHCYSHESKLINKKRCDNIIQNFIYLLKRCASQKMCPPLVIIQWKWRKKFLWIQFTFEKWLVSSK